MLVKLLFTIETTCQYFLQQTWCANTGIHRILDYSVFRSISGIPFIFLSYYLYLPLIIYLFLLYVLYIDFFITFARRGQVNKAELSWA